MKKSLIVLLLVLSTIMFTFALKPVKAYDIHVEYPVFSGLENPVVEVFINTYIENEVNRYTEDFESFVAESWTSPSGAPFQLHITFDVKYSKTPFISVVLYIYRFEGGAHGITNVISLNFDTTSGKLLRLKDIFEAGFDYESVIKSEILSKIEETPENFFEEAVGCVKNDKLDDRNFALTEDGLIIIFEEYELAPRYFGILEFKIPLEKLEIKEGFKISFVR